MSACPSFSFSCDNNNWNCCGDAKDTDQQPAPQPQPQPAPQQQPQPMQPPPRVVAAPPHTTHAHGSAPPSYLVLPHESSPAPAPKRPVTAPHAPVPPCCNKAHEPPAPATIPATLPSKPHEPAWTVAPRAPVPPNESRLLPPARALSKKHEPPTPPPARTAWPARVPSKTYDNGGVPAMSTMRPPVPHRIYEAPSPAVTPPQPTTSTAPRARASQYPPSHHPQHDDTDSRVESYSQEHLQEYCY